MQEASALIKDYQDFTSFSKRNTQSKTFLCEIMESDWSFKDNQLIYSVKANRFLRGMVRAMVATILQAGRGKLSIEEFKSIIESKDCTKANFAAPAQGLFLSAIVYPPNYF
jgi:tRNA pseudouridine38-40 synthase